MSIHKSTLLHCIKEIPVERLQVVEDNILECLALGLIEEVDGQEEIS